jgi:hypothetical protein
MSTRPKAKTKTIGTLREKSLHAALKQHYAKKNDVVEAKLDGYSIDIVRGDVRGDVRGNMRGQGKGRQRQRQRELIEIQTRSFASAKRKLQDLVQRHKVLLVHPIAQEKTIVRYDANGVLLARRRSPKRGCIEDVFVELVSFPELLAHPNFALEVVLTHEEEVQHDDGRGSWRRGGRSIFDRRLVEIVAVLHFDAPSDFLQRLPAALPAQFTNAELAQHLGKPRWLASKMTYCLWRMGALEKVGKRGKANVFSR